VQYFFQRQVHVAANVRIPDGVLDFDDVVVGRVADEFDDAPHFVADVGEVFDNK
jgi:hypothetical protein